MAWVTGMPGGNGSRSSLETKSASLNAAWRRPSTHSGQFRVVAPSVQFSAFTAGGFWADLVRYAPHTDHWLDVAECPLSTSENT